MRSHGCLNRDF